MSKTVQIPMELFTDLCKYHLLQQNSWEDNLNQPIERGLQEKLDSLVKRELYTKYKTSPSTEEKELARLEYLKRIGLKNSFVD